MPQGFLKEAYVKRYLFFFDLIALLTSVLLVHFIRFSSSFWAPVSLIEGWVFIGSILLVLYLSGNYEYFVPRFKMRELSQFLFSLILSSLSVVVLIYLFRWEVGGIFGRGVLAGSLALFFILGCLHRSVFIRWVNKNRSKIRWLVVGDIKYLNFFYKDLQRCRAPGQFFFLQDKEVSDRQKGVELVIPEKRILGTSDRLYQLNDKQWSGIILALSDQRLEQLSEALMKLRLSGARVMDLTDFYEAIWQKVPVYYLRKIWFAVAHGFQLLHNPFDLKIKRLYDILLSVVLIVLTLPLLLLGALLIRFDTKGATFFKQKRTGEGGKVFTIFKLRTMVENAEMAGAQWAQKNDVRITRAGRFLRKSRIDELPQLVNVLKGEMSFIGPRPERPEFNKKLENQIPHYNLRHLLKPGITGLAQVLYPYGASVEDAKEKLQYELYYIKNYSLVLDLLVILRTIRVVLRGLGR